MRSKFLAFKWMAALVLLTQWVGAAESPPKACAGKEYRQFDFWLGSWQVYEPGGKKVGDSRIERINDGCALLENWQGTGGVSGKSLNIYDAADKQWHQFWVDSGASRLLLKGGVVGASMVLMSSEPDPEKPGAVLAQKITWSRNEDGSVRQLWQTSTDGGRSWTTSFDGKYVKTKPR